MGYENWQCDACSGRSGSSEGDDADLVAAELGHVIALGRQQGDRLRLAQGNLGGCGVDCVRVPVQSGTFEKLSRRPCRLFGDRLHLDAGQGPVQAGMSVREWLASTMVLAPMTRSAPMSWKT